MVDVPVLRANGSFARVNAVAQSNGSVAVSTTTTAGNTTLTINAPNGEWVKLDMYNDGSGSLQFSLTLV